MLHNLQFQKMAASIIHPYEWSHDNIQSFLYVSPRRDEIGLYISEYKDSNYNLTKRSAKSFESILSYGYSAKREGKNQWVKSR